MTTLHPSTITTPRLRLDPLQPGDADAMVTVLDAVVEWLTDEGVERIRALIHPEHHASAAVAQRAGFLRTAEVVDGEVVWVRDSS